MKKDHDKEKMTIIEASKVNKQVARGGKCWKNIWLGILSVTGELFNCQKHLHVVLHITYCILLKVLLLTLPFTLPKFPETWILPITVLFAMGAYAVLAIAFYHNDG